MTSHPRRRPCAQALAVAAAALGAACRASAAGGSAPTVDRLRVPAGFRVSVFSSAVPGARSLTRGAKGTVFVGTQKGSVYGVVDGDGDGVADQVATIAQGLDMPNGVAFRQGALYVAELSRIRRYDGIEDRLASPPTP